MTYISAIAVFNLKGTLSVNNKLPWHLPNDLKYFKEMIHNKAIITGRKTYKDMIKYTPSKYITIVTRDHTFSAPGCSIVYSIQQALESVKNEREVMVVGGSEIYEQTLPYLSRIYLTLVNDESEGDTYFPELDTKEWYEVSKRKYMNGENELFTYDFIILDRANQPKGIL